MASTFDERIGVLSAEIGEGIVTGKVEYDQAYAHRQHEELTWKHPHGGQAQYLSSALYENIYTYMEMIAQFTLEDGGPRIGMIGAVESLARESASRVPYSLGTLRNSVHPSVEENGVVVYDRPPQVPRLSDAELDYLHKLQPWEHGPREGYGPLERLE